MLLLKVSRFGYFVRSLISPSTNWPSLEEQKSVCSLRKLRKILPLKINTIDQLHLVCASSSVLCKALGSARNQLPRDVEHKPKEEASFERKKDKEQDTILTSGGAAIPVSYEQRNDDNLHHDDIPQTIDF